jgi:hypothetical protein
MSTISEDGSYSVLGVASGPVKIRVETQSAKPPPGPPPGAGPPGGVSAFGQDSGPNAARRNMSKDRYVEIPAKYAKVETSGLNYTIKSGAQKYDINLE